MRVSLIVAAGGAGQRFRAGLEGASREKASPPSKVFYPLRGKPVLIHSLQAFDGVPEIREKILVIPRALEKEVRRLLAEYGIRDFRLVHGGATRAESVWNGLKQAATASDWVMVHDAARPLVTKKALRGLMRGTSKADGAILASRIIPTVKQELPGTGLIGKTLDRNLLYGAETPQMARRELLLKAYKSLPNALQATDEASLLEALRAKTRLVLHEGWNPKITTYNDLILAERYLGGGEIMHRTGLGKDLHRLEKGRKLYLGGIAVPSELGSLGHSDGDVVLHALIDGILGALGKGDIGEWFSDRSKRYKGIRSPRLLAPVLEEAAKGGWKVAHADFIITLEKPKLGAYKEKIRKNLARLIAVPFEDISIKAKTAEGLGPEGEGRALSCDAVVTLIRN